MERQKDEKSGMNVFGWSSKAMMVLGLSFTADKVKLSDRFTWVTSKSTGNGILKELHKRDLFFFK